MKKSIALVFPFILLFVIAGCFLGDRHSLTRTVSLNFQEPRGASEVALSLTNAEVQEALKIIETVMSSNGFVRDSRPDMATVPGFVVAYVRHGSSGLRSGTLTDVYLEGRRLDVAIVELGNRTTHPTALTDKICKSLRNELGSHYGAARISVK